VEYGGRKVVTDRLPAAGGVGWEERLQRRSILQKTGACQVTGYRGSRSVPHPYLQHKTCREGM